MKSVSITETEYLELLRYKYIVQSFEQMLHEPEFQKEFEDRVKAAEARVEQGEKIKFNSADELDKHLDE